MNKQFALIITIATVLLLTLLIALSAFRSTTANRGTESQFTSPTSSPIKRGGNGYSTIFDTITPKPTLPQPSQDALLAFHKILPFNSDALSIDYSSLTNKVYIEQKNEKADEELQKFLTNNQLLDLYQMHPDLFVLTKSKLSQAINRDEQVIDFPPEDASAEITPALNYTDQRKQNQTSTFNTLVKNLLTFKVPGAETQDILVVKVSGNNPTPTENIPTLPASGSPPKITTGKDTTNIPCAAGTDYGAADGYTNGVLTRIRICRVAGMVVNSQVSKQVNDMHTAWAAAGIPLSGGSFRRMSDQINVYQNWCKNDGIVGSPPPYPKPPGQTIRCPGGGAPGYSNHQMGMAIDFSCAGSLIPRKYAAASQNKCFQWLAANAGRFGFFEYGYGRTRDGSTGYEGWHWSVNGN